MVTVCLDSEKSDKQAKYEQNRPKCIGSEEQKWYLETVIR